MELRGKQFEGNSLLLSKIDSGMLEVRTEAQWPRLAWREDGFQVFLQSQWEPVLLLPIASQD